MQDVNEHRGLFDRWRNRLASALLREPSVVLIEREAHPAPDATAGESSRALLPEKMH